MSRVPSVQAAAVILFGCVCHLRRIPCITVSFLRVLDCDCSLCLGLCLCDCDLLWLYEYDVYHPIRALLSDWGFGLCVHVSRSPSFQTAVILPGWLCVCVCRERVCIYICGSQVSL